MRYLFRVDISNATGLGHITRCLAFATALHKTGSTPIFVVNSDAKGIFEIPALFSVFSCESSMSMQDWPDAEVCIVDLYEYSADYYKNLSKKYSRIAIFDDCMFQAPESISAIINPNIYANSSMYPPGVLVFAGPHYYLLRQEFTDCPPESHDGTHVLICMGGSDPEGQTGRILAIVRRVTDRPIDVVFGSPNQESSLADYSGLPGVTLHKSVDRMRPLMDRAAYAVVGAGTLLYELAYMGVPAACLSLAENQRMNAEAFAEKNAALFIGHHKHVPDDAIAAAIARLEHETALRAAIKGNAQKLIDGLGAKRLAKDLAAWILTGI